MKKTLLFVTCSLLCLASCDKIFVHVSETAAEIQGKWQMENADSVFYNFQNNLFQYQIYMKPNAISQAYGFYYVRGNNELELRLLKELSTVSLDHLEWDTHYSASGKQDTVVQTFKIDKVTRTQLILQSDKGKISFHKF